MKDDCAFINGIAAIFWGSAWADHCEEAGCYNLSGCKIEEHMPEIPERAYRAAHRVLGRIEESTGLHVAVLFAKAWRADGRDPENIDYHGDLAEHFGECLAYASMGAGVAWEDEHTPFPELSEADLYGCEDAGGVSIDLQEYASSTCERCRRATSEQEL